MPISLSLNEVLRKSARAFRALNYPPGSDLANATNVMWLEVVGFSGLKYLCEEITRGPYGYSASFLMPTGKKGRKTLACGGQSGFVFAQTAVDFAEIGEVVNITNCFHPVIFLAELVRRAHLTDGFSLEWIIDGVKTKGRCRKGQASITVGGSGDGLASHLTIYRDNNFRSQYSQMLLASVPKNGQRFILSAGREWDKICRAGDRTLVPDSPISRTSAGPEVDDST